MEFVKIGSPELSASAKNPLRSVTSKIVVLANKSKQKSGKNDFSVLRGSAGVEIPLVGSDA